MGNDLENQREHEKEMASIEARKIMACETPILFVIWYLGIRLIEWTGIVALILLMAQCSCDGCIWR